MHGGGHDPTQIDVRAVGPDDTVDRYHALLRADIISTATGTAISLVVASIWWVMPIFAWCVSGVACLGIRQLGRRFASRGDVQTAILLFAFGLWASGLVILWIAPIGLPIIMFNLVTPVVIAGTFLDREQHRRVALGAVVMSAAMGAIGWFADGYAIEEGVANWIVGVVIIIFMVEHTAMFTATVRDANAVTTRHFDQAMAANAELERSEAELRRSRRRVVDVAERERRRIERDIHDGAQQRLVSAALQIQLASLDAEAGAHVAAERLDGIRAELQTAVNDLRELASGIFPSMLADHGLRDAVHAVARLNPQPVVVDIPPNVDLPDRVTRAVYFIAVEALQNAAKHAGPDARVSVAVVVDERCVALDVCDDGVGFEPGGDDLGGLANMSDRAAAEGGELSVDARLGHGTTIRVVIPHGGVA